ncbi:O-antigen ligase family protein [Lusitaniella coriacea]|uniref:O-antigen ligase family protein n=1 Tax=Lusitaniella coriacea TaxID=1983105 RepID=UPI003CF15CAC
MTDKKRDRGEPLPLDSQSPSSLEENGLPPEQMADSTVRETTSRRLRPDLCLAPDPRLEWHWNFFQWGLLMFPLMPTIGIIPIILAMLSIWQQQYRQMIQLPLNRALGILSLLLIVSASFAEKPGEAFLGLFNLLPLFACFVALRQLIQTPAQLRRIAWIFAIASIPAIILGFGQILGGWASPQWVLSLFAWVMEAEGRPPGRMSSIFMYANILAAYLLIVLTLSLGLWLDTYKTWREDRTLRQQWLLLLLAVIIIGDVGALVFTSSRNVWGVAILACLAFALHIGWKWLVLGVTTAAGIVLWASFGPTLGRDSLRRIVPGYFWRRLSGEMYSPPPVAELRTSQWQFTLEMARDRPLFGWGLRNFSPLYEAQTQVWLGHPHNLFFMFLAEMGIPAFLLFCGIVGWILARAILLLRIWSNSPRVQWHQNSSILFTYLVTFGSLILFNLLDVTIFDFRINFLGYIILSAICGVTYRYRMVLEGRG